ncbi:SNF2-related protein [Nonomuraea sp. NPDC050663]|uniref:SNF2-related protein n=1 Tax=Nonomuraea sp. NPDC050663 TaxID=3364370 RepID=UPI0037BC4088
MLVVHGVWTTTGLAFWGESPTTAPQAPTTTPTHPVTGTDAISTHPVTVPAAHPFASPDAIPTRSLSGLDAAPAHPFAASSEDLRLALGLADSASSTAEHLTLLLPGTARGPSPSPETGLLPTTSRPTLRRWQVPALLPHPAETLRLLTETLHPPASTATLRHWRAVAAFAHDLVRRGRVIPQLTGEPAQQPDMWSIPEPTAEARWFPVLTGADATHFRDLATAMPPACRTGAEEHPSSTVLTAALAALTDAAVRARLTEPLVARPRTLEDRWLAALTGPDAACPDIPELRRSLTAWREAAGAEGATQVCFRLSEPPTPTQPATPDPALHADTTTGAAPDPTPQAATTTGAASDPTSHADAGPEPWWRVELALQPLDDPSLRVPADQIWSGSPIPGLPPRADHELLAGLGRALRLYPALDPALRTAHPTELLLDTAGAFTFLRQAAPLLHAAGFVVQLPRWAGRTKLGLKLTTRTKKQQAATSQGFGLQQLVDFKVELAVGDATITEAELTELARLKVPLVRVRGQWVELDERQLKAALRAVETRREGELTAAEILQHVIQGDEGELPLVEVDADGVLGDLLSGTADRRLTPIPTPPGIDAVLRPYQERGLAWLSFLSELGLGGVLADDMGLGKTISTLSLLVHEKSGRPTLLVCPMSLIGNWQREAARFAPGLRVHVHHGASRDPAKLTGADLVITTYGTAQRDLDTLKQVAWRRVVCDEAQAIKNSGTLQAQAVRSITAETRLALTGTPVENHLAELWSIMEFCNPGLLGSKQRFRTRFQEPIEARQDAQAEQALKRATGPFVLRRLKTDKSIISDLPEKLEVKEWCTLTPEQASLYQAVVDDMMGKIDGSEGIERRGLVLAAMAKLKQVCNHPAHLLKDGSRLAGRSGKLARTEELAAEILAEGEKGLLFTQYSEYGSMLQPYLAQRLDRPVLWLHGGLPKKTRDRLVERFQRDDEPMLFLLSLKAAGVGLNLTAANHVIHLDRWWNPAVEDQATDRAFRIGQRKNVQVRKLICAGTLEERIDEMIERKKALAERVVGTGEDWLTDLSTAELREVFRLGAGAVT